MDKLKIVFAAVVGCSLLAAASRAQDTNAYAPVPATKLEIMETNTGMVLIKGTAPVGSISVSGGAVSVTCKEDTDTGAGRKEYGIAITVKAGSQSEDRTIVDYDELDSLLTAIDYLSTINWSATALSSFNAAYSTKGRFRIAAVGSKRLATIEFNLRGSHLSKSTPISPSQLAQFRALIDQAKRELDSIRSSK
jgi:hypothetical protein